MEAITTTKSTQVFGRKLMAEGYLNDSQGDDLKAEVLYNVTYIPYTEVRTIYPVGMVKRRKQVEIKRRPTSEQKGR